MESDRDAGSREQLLDGGEILSCTFATMDMLSEAVAAELGDDEAEAYGLTRRRPELGSVPAEDGQAGRQAEGRAATP